MKVALALLATDREETSAKATLPLTNFNRLVIAQRKLSMCGLL